MNSVCNAPSVRKGNFVTVNIPVKQYATLRDSKTLPADTVYQVTYVSRNNPNLIRIYGGNMVGSRSINANDVTVVPGPQPNVKVGDMFAADWGYDQTQTTWLKVVAVKPKTATLVRLGETRKYDGPMHGQATVDVNRVVGNPKNYRINTTHDGKVYFRIASYACAFPATADSRYFSEWH